MHHYVAQLTLRGFANEKNQITTVPLGGGEPYTQSVERTAAENHYNTVRNKHGDTSDIVEKTIAEHIEGPAAAPLKAIAAGNWVEDEERSAVALFLSLQHVRIPAQRAFRDSTTDLLLKLQMAADGPSGMRRILEAERGGPVPDEDVEAAWEELRDFDDWSFKLPREHHIKQTLELAVETAPIFEREYSWSVMQWARRHLLTSDLPVVLVAAPDAPSWRGVGLLTAGQIWFPVDRHTALVLTNRSLTSAANGASLAGTAAVARRVNSLVASAAYRRVFHHPDDALADLVVKDFVLPEPREITHETDHTTFLMGRLRSMAEWHFKNPDQPHPMSRAAPSSPPPPGARPWRPES